MFVVVTEREVDSYIKINMRQDVTSTDKGSKIYLDWLFVQAKPVVDDSNIIKIL